MNLVRSVIARISADPMARNSAAIMVSTVATSVLGYGFWLLLAHVSSTEVSGRGATVTSALQATALLASVGAAAAMVEWLPRSTDPHIWRQRLTVGIVVAVVTGLVGAVVVAGLLGTVAGTLHELAGPEGFLLFCVGSVSFAVGTVLDYVAVAERRGGLMLLRNVVFNGLRIPLLFVPGLVWKTEHMVLASWAVSALLSLLVAVYGFNRGSRRSGRNRLALTFGSVRVHTREMAGSLVGQHLITIAATLVMYLLPIIVAIRLSVSDGAYFYATWMLGSVFFMISPAVSTSLFAEGSTGSENARALVGRASKIIGALLVVPIVVYLAAGGLILELFGSEYAHHGRMLLILLTVSAIPDAVTNVAVALLRATRRMAQALWLNVAMLLLCVVLSWVLSPSVGIAAVGLAWLVSQCAGSVWVLLSWRRIVDPDGTGRRPAPRHRYTKQMEKAGAVS